MKVTVVCFGNISSKNELAALAFYNYSLVTYLFEKRLLDKVYCLDYDETVAIPASSIRRFSGTLFSKASYLISILLEKTPLNFTSRLIMEKAFDQFVSFQENFSKSTLLLNIKGINLALYKVAKKKQIPVVILADTSHPVFIYNLVKKLEKLYNCKDNSSYTNKPRIKHLCKAYEQADLVIPMIGAEFIINSFAANNITPNKVAPLKNLFGVDVSTFKPKIYHPGNQLQPITFFTVNQAGLKKGLLPLIDAYSLLDPQEQKNSQLLIAGSIDSCAMSYISTARTNGTIKYVGYLKKVFEGYQSADVFISASIEDLGPRTVLEAMAAGLPVIVSKGCGVADWIEPGVEGFIYDPFNVKELTKLLQWMIANPGEAREMGKRARSKVLCFSDQIYNAEIVSVLESIQ